MMSLCWALLDILIFALIIFALGTFFVLHDDKIILIRLPLGKETGRGMTGSLNESLSLMNFGSFKASVRTWRKSPILKRSLKFILILMTRYETYDLTVICFLKCVSSNGCLKIKIIGIVSMDSLIFELAISVISYSSEHLLSELFSNCEQSSFSFGLDSIFPLFDTLSPSYWKDHALSSLVSVELVNSVGDVDSILL